MVKAATDIQYGNQFYKEDSELPEDLVKEFEKKNPEQLDNYVEVNGRWFKVDDPRIKGFVQEQKYSNHRLRKYFNKEISLPGKEPESHMLKTHPARIKLKKKK